MNLIDVHDPDVFRQELDKVSTAVHNEPIQPLSAGDEHFRLYRTVDGQPEHMDPRVIAAKVLNFPEHEHLARGEPTIDWLFRTERKSKQGRRILGTCYCEPSVQGDLSSLFEDMLIRLLGAVPDFLIVLDWEYWSEATPLAREILVHHELLHADHAKDVFGSPRFTKDGLPIYCIRGHDIEEFDEVVRRYGVHSEDLQRFLQAVTDNMENGL